MIKNFEELKCNIWPPELSKDKWHKDYGTFRSLFKPATNIDRMLVDAEHFFDRIPWNEYKKYYYDDNIY